MIWNENSDHISKGNFYWNQYMASQVDHFWEITHLDIIILLYLLKKSHYSYILYSLRLEHAGKGRTREGLLISMRTFCSMLPSTLPNSKNENVLVTVETSERWNAETNANCNPKIVILGFIQFFQNEKDWAEGNSKNSVITVLLRGQIN